MNEFRVIDNWMNQIRLAAGYALVQCLDSEKLNLRLIVRMQILLYQYLGERVASQIARVERISTEEAREIENTILEKLRRKAVPRYYGEQMTWFIEECSRGVHNTFKLLLRREMEDTEVQYTDEKAEAIFRIADRKMDEYIHERLEPYGCDDDMPENMDEFEYVDWCIAHKPRKYSR